jgi:hypothetical protein
MMNRIRLRLILITLVVAASAGYGYYWYDTEYRHREVIAATKKQCDELTANDKEGRVFELLRGRMTYRGKRRIRYQ